MLSATRYELTRARLTHFLEELKASSLETASLCIPPGSSRIDIEGMLETILGAGPVPEDISESISGSPTGAVLFWGPHHRYLVMPPFPLHDKRVSNTCEIEPLRSLLHREFLFGLVVVRSGAFTISVIQGEAIITRQAGTGLVHSRHRQGGSSAHRFERHREKQMETFFTRVCGHVREQLEPYANQLEYIIYGGTRETVTDFRKQCHFLRQFDNRVIDRLLNIREPRKSGLEEAVQEAWSSRVIRFDEK
jgi:hypothetical protein